MAGFQFTDIKVPLDIAGHKFSANATTAMVFTVSECADSVLKILNNNDEKNDLETLNTLEKKLRENIDKILGDGSCEKIFEGREADYFDTLEVMNYITGAIMEKHNSRPALKASYKR